MRTICRISWVVRAFMSCRREKVGGDLAGRVRFPMFFSILKAFLADGLGSVYIKSELVETPVPSTSGPEGMPPTLILDPLAYRLQRTDLSDQEMILLLQMPASLMALELDLDVRQEDNTGQVIDWSEASCVTRVSVGVPAL